MLTLIPRYATMMEEIAVWTVCSRTIAKLAMTAFAKILIMPTLTFLMSHLPVVSDFSIVL